MAKVDRCLTQTEIDSPLKGTIEVLVQLSVWIPHQIEMQEVRKRCHFQLFIQSLLLGHFNCTEFFVYFQIKQWEISLKLAVVKDF